MNTLPKENLNFTGQVLVLLLPISLVTGPFFSDLFIILLGLLFIYNFFSKNIEFKNYNYLFFFLFFYLIIITISITSEYKLNSLSSSLFYFRFIFFSYALAFFLYYYNNLHEKLILSISILLIFLSLDALFQYIFGYNFIGMKNQYPWTSEYGDGEYHRISGMFGEELKLGSYLFKIFSLLTALFFLTKKYIKKYLTIYLITFILVFSTILITGERTALMHILIFLTLCLITFNFDKKIKLLIFFIFISIFSLFLYQDKNLQKRYTTILDTIYSIDNDLFPSNYNRNVKPNEKVLFTSHHTAHYKSAWKMFRNNYMTGVGPKNFRKLCSNKIYFVESGCSTHPHSVYMQLLAETGLLGFILILSFFTYHSILIFKEFYYRFISSCKNQIQNYNSYMVILITIFINLFPLSPSGSFFNNWNSIMFFLPIGFLIFLKQNNE